MNATGKQSAPAQAVSMKRNDPRSSCPSVTSVGPSKGAPFFTRRSLWWAVAGLGLLGMMTPTPMGAQSNSAPQILFLHLRVKNQAVSLMGSVTRPGVLKPPRDAAPGDLHYELSSASSKPLWKAAVADPTILRLEYEDPPGSGNLKRKTVVLNETEFTVRVPVVPEARRVDFYKLEPAGAPNAKGERAMTRRALGNLSLP